MINLQKLTKDNPGFTKQLENVIYWEGQRDQTDYLNQVESTQEEIEDWNVINDTFQFALSNLGLTWAQYEAVKSQIS